MIWIQFIVSSGLIVFSGIKLTTYADLLSDRLHIGKVWIGVILLGLVTSLPEAVASLTAVLYLLANDLAIGNMVGSNNFNILLIVVMDIIYRRDSITNCIPFGRSQIYPAFLALLLTSIVVFEIYLSSKITLWTIGPISLGCFMIIVLYFFGIRLMAGHQSPEDKTIDLKEETTREGSLKTIYLNLIWNAVIVVVAAMWLANIADKIATFTGLGRTFVGTIFLAFVTSLPEMVVTIVAVKLGALDLAIGNIFGSNMNNMFLAAICDVFAQGSIFALVSKTHIITGLLSVILTVIALAGIRHKNKRTFIGIGWDSIVLMCCFLLGMSFLYQFK